jgi:outer membrane receptor protein involved in Fe transport
MNFKFYLLITAFACLVSNVLYAQHSLSGKISDSDGNPLIGAVVMLTSNLGTVSDIDGNYSISAKEGDYTVKVTSVGMKPASAAVALRGNITQDFTLETDALGLEEVLVTSVRNNQSKLESSVSVSTLSPRTIDQLGARTTTEIFRSIPGIRSEASGGEGNTNITVRGVPISSGGSKYVQLQEDGLPVLLFGDIAFGTADIFLRADQSISRIEAIRGGSASTLSSNSPAGIINFISNTGGVSGGTIATTVGLDNKLFRTDFGFGAPIGDNWNFHIGGFFRQGEGVRTAGYDANSGGQVKMNLTRSFEKGYARVYFKHLNDRAAAYMPLPMKVSGTNADPTWEAINDNFSPTTGALQTPYLLQNTGLNGAGAMRSVNVADGMHPVSNAIGAEFSFDLGDGWKVENRGRLSFNSGRFVAPFPAQVATGQALAESLGGGGSTLQYADNGAAFTGSDLALRIHMFDTELNNFDNMMNDAKLSKQFGKLSATLGYFNALQNVNMSWLWNSYITDVNGNGARMLNVIDSLGNNISQNGLYAYGVPAWGNCCQRNYNTQHVVSAPYVNLGVEITDALNLDAAARWDMGSVTGSYAGSVQSTQDMNNDGVISPNEESVSGINTAAAMPVNYDYDYLSYSLGANYKIKDNMAVFARYSSGAAAKADRILFSPAVDAQGHSTFTADQVSQAELGWKYRFAKGGLFLTAFYANTNEEGGYEATTQKIIENDYSAMGLELEGAINVKGIDVRGGATYTNAQISSGDNEGNTPRRQAALIFNLNPSYSFKAHTIGLNIMGSTSSYAQDDNLLVLPGYALINMYLGIGITNNLSLTLSGNNLLDSIAVTESEEGSIVEGQDNYLRARPMMGRSINASVRYNF